MSEAGGASSPGAVSPRLIEVRWDAAAAREAQGGFVVVWVGLLGVLGIALLLGIRRFDLSLAAVMSAICVLPLTAFGMIAFDRRLRRRRFRAAMAEYWGAADARLIDFGAILGATGLPIGSWTIGPLVDELALRMVREGMAGRAIRVCTADDVVAIAPVASVFEPVKLDSMDEGFQRFVEAIDFERAGDSAPSGSARRWSLQSDRLGRIMVDIFTVAFSIVMMLNAGGLAPKVIGGSILLVWVGVQCERVLLDERQLYLVPGGVLVRKSRGVGKVWRRRLFSRNDSVLVVWRGKRGEGRGWRALLRSGLGQALIGLNGIECEVLLRAWLSDVPTPGLERLGDLA